METLIYIPVIEGINYYIPVQGKPIGDAFKILDDPKFELEDGTILYKFLPGDIVEVSSQHLKNQIGDTKIFPVAVKLIGEQSSERRLKNLQYLIAEQEGLLSEQQHHDYAREINDLKEQVALSEIDIHPAVIRWYNK